MKKLLPPFVLPVFSSVSPYVQNKDWLTKMQNQNVDFWGLLREFKPFWQGQTGYNSNVYKVVQRWEYIREAHVGLYGVSPAREYTSRMAKQPQEKPTSGTWTLSGSDTFSGNNTSQPNGQGRTYAFASSTGDANAIWGESPGCIT